MSIFKKEEMWRCPDCGATGRVRYPRFGATQCQIKCSCGTLILFKTDGVSFTTFAGPNANDTKRICKQLKWG